MLSVRVHRDITAYQPKVIGGLTRRTLGFTALALGLGLVIGATAWLVFGVPADLMVGPIFLVSIPCWALGYARPHDMSFERFATLWLRMRYQPQGLGYRSSAAIRRDELAPVPARSARERHYARLAQRRGIEAWRPGEERG